MEELTKWTKNYMGQPVLLQRFYNAKYRVKKLFVLKMFDVLLFVVFAGSATIM